MLPARKLKTIGVNKSFTLIEVIVFIAMIIVLFVSVLSIYIRILNLAIYNENKIIATHYAEELSEWLFYQRDISWNELFSFNGDYCFNTSDITPISGICTGYNLGEGRKQNTFKRQASFTPSNSSLTFPYTDVKITVSWISSGIIHEVHIYKKIYKSNL